MVDTAPELKIALVVLEVIRALGLPGLVSLLLIVVAPPWIMLGLRLRHEAQTRGILEMYKTDMDQVRRMYENNVSLVRDYTDLTRSYRELAGGLRDVIIMNTQAMQRLGDAVHGNQFCPAMRKKRGDIEG